MLYGVGWALVAAWVLGTTAAVWLIWQADLPATGGVVGYMSLIAGAVGTLTVALVLLDREGPP